MNTILWMMAGGIAGGLSGIVFVGISAALAALDPGPFTPEQAAYIGFVTYSFALSPLYQILWALRRRGERGS